jgi:hypothetical protein
MHSRANIARLFVLGSRTLYVMRRFSRVSTLFAIALAGCCMSVSVASAWSAPTSTAPAGNVAAPLNTGSGSQTKTGVLNITNGFTVGGNTLWAGAAGGNVGVGNSAPAAKLHVTGNAAVTGWVGAGCETSCETGGGYAIMYDNGIINTYHPSGDSSYAMNIDSRNNYGAIIFNINNWTRLGHDGYGVYTNGAVAAYPANSSYWAGDFRAAGGYGLYAQNGSGYYSQMAYSSYGLQTNGAIQAISAYSGNWAGDFRASGGYGMYIENASGYYSQLAYSSYGLYTNGYVYGPAFYYTSDARLKKDVKPLNSGIMTLLKLNPVSFTWNEKSGETRAGNHDIGLIAQEVEPLVPEAVRTDEITGYKMVDYPRLVPVLIQAIKDQQKQIDSQQALIEELRSDVQALKAARD